MANFIAIVAGSFLLVVGFLGFRAFPLSFLAFLALLSFPTSLIDLIPLVSCEVSFLPGHMTDSILRENVQMHRCRT